MRTLTLSTGTFDQENTFNIKVGTKYCPVKTVRLMQGFDKQDDGVYWAMGVGACIKSSYTAKDSDEQARLLREAPVENGEIVLIDGKQYKIKINGDYSDAAMFVPVP